MKSKFTAGILCLLVGGLGIHEFYLGDTKKGIYYIIAFIICAVTGFGAILYLIFQIGVAIHYFTMDQKKFDEKYNPSLKTHTPYPGFGTIQYVDDQGYQTQKQEAAALQADASKKSKILQLKELKHLLDEGLISQEEFDTKKQKILNS